MMRERIQRRNSLSGPLVCLAGLAAGFLLMTPFAGQKGRAPAPKQIQYIDVSSNSRIEYRSENNFTGRKYFPQSMCGGVAVLDYDRDGRMDLFFTNGAKLPELIKTDPSFYHCLLRNNGDGSFADITEKAGLAGKDLGFCFGVAAADYDNDGFADLFIAAAGRNTLYHNDGRGRFTDASEGSGLDRKEKDLLSVGGAWFDYDNDGLLDLAVANYTYWSPQTDKRCVNGDAEIYCYPDVYPSVPQRLYRNLGRGRFEDVTERAGWGSFPGKGMGIGIADFNDDGWQDVFIANDTVRNFLFLNQKNGTFQETALLYGVAYNEQAAVVSGMGADVRDFDNDGWVDLFYNDLSAQIFGLFKNQGGKYFTYVSGTHGIDRASRPYTGWGCGFLDYNNDGWKDIFSANGELEPLMKNAKQNLSMFENIEGKRFVDISAKLGAPFSRPGFGRGSAFADLNNDGFVDVVSTALGEMPRILMNSADNGAHWLEVELEGRKSNRDAIGARLLLTTAGGRRMTNHVAPSAGFISSSDKRVHFGLGRERRIKTLEIRWPSGAIKTLHDLPADRILKAVE
jgi:enediyne biosynthesis protein E4